MRQPGYLWLLLVAPVAACWGDAFTAVPGSGGGASGGGGSAAVSSASATTGEGGHADASRTSSAGGIGSSGLTTGAGGASSASATTTSSATADATGVTSGAGGAGSGTGGATATGSCTGGAGGSPCDGVSDGASYGGHCYVRVFFPASTVSFTDTVSACKDFGESLGRTAYPPILNSLDEEAFLKSTFVQPGRSQDAWLGFVCDKDAHPNQLDCYCVGGCLTELGKTQKTQAWSWLDGTSSPFQHWVGLRPNGEGRCAAIGDGGPEWGWADHACDQATYLTPEGVRTFQPLCEIE